jgi:hypothetical protein
MKFLLASMKSLTNCENPSSLLGFTMAACVVLTTIGRKASHEVEKIDQ